MLSLVVYGVGVGVGVGDVVGCCYDRGVGVVDVCVGAGLHGDGAYGVVGVYVYVYVGIGVVCYVVTDVDGVLDVAFVTDVDVVVTYGAVVRVYIGGGVTVVVVVVTCGVVRCGSVAIVYGDGVVVLTVLSLLRLVM